MPRAEEICVVTINGEVFRDWETVSAVAPSQGDCLRRVTLTITEKTGKSGSVNRALQILPNRSIAVTVTLAGVLFCTGTVYERQASYDANNHGVRIVICSVVTPITHSSVPLKASQFKNYNYEAIVRALIKPFGLNLRIASKPDGFDKPFRKVAVIPGEPVWNFIERLARSRGARLSDDANGNLVVRGNEQTASIGGLVEGQNILSANCLMNTNPPSSIEVDASQPGSDNISVDQARGSAANVTIKGVADYSPIIVHHEGTGDSDDAARRADYEQTHINLKAIQATIAIQGWLKDDGTLWDVFEFVHVHSPMLAINRDLQIAEVTYSQDQNGTRTTFLLEKNVPVSVSANANPDDGLPNYSNGVPRRDE